MYKVTDRFTTYDGSWTPDNKEYSITQAMVDKYQNNFPEKGGATHLFAKIEGGPSKKVKFFTRDSQHQVVAEIKESGWANQPIEHGSAYKPDKGESGWWDITVDGAPSEVAEGFGLPFSWHVSNFVVFKWDTAVEEPNDPPTVPPSVNPIAVDIVLTQNGKSVTYSGIVTKK